MREKNIIFHHIIPNVMSLILVNATLSFCDLHAHRVPLSMRSIPSPLSDKENPSGHEQKGGRQVH